MPAGALSTRLREAVRVTALPCLLSRAVPSAKKWRPTSGAFAARTNHWAEAAAAAIRGYGPEIFAFLVSRHHNDLHAEEVFSIWSERLWRGLREFAWACSLRTWAYTLARNAS